MKRLRRVCLGLSIVSSIVLVSEAQTPPEVSTRAVERGRHFTVMETVRQKTNDASFSTNRYTILGNAINRLDEDGSFVECKPVVLSYPSGIVCTGAAFSVIIGTNLDVDLETADKQRIVSRLCGIAFHDAESGKTVWLASTKSGPAEVISNRVVFRDAFEGNGVEASLVYEYRAGRFSQSIVFSKALALSPSDFGMTSGRLELITELVQSPTPTVTEHVVASQNDPAKRATMAEPDVVDQTLKFGSEDGMRMPLGRAFASGSPPQQGIIVTKRLVQAEDNRTALIESMDWNAAKVELQKLPPASTSVSASNLVVSLKRQWPARTVQVPSSFAAHLTQVRQGQPGTLASLGSQRNIPRGFEADYELVEDTFGFYFAEGTTYYVPSQVYLVGVTRFEGNSVIKFAPYASLNISGSIFNPDWEPYIPYGLILTAWDDDSEGDIIDGSTGGHSYSAFPALALEYLDYDTFFDGLDFRYCNAALSIDSSSARTVTALTANLSDIQYWGIQVGALESLAIGNLHTCNVSGSLYEETTPGTVSIASLLDCSDSDADGLLDEWEMNNFGNLNQVGSSAQGPNWDYDGDGISNADECFFGTDPNTVTFDVAADDFYVNADNSVAATIVLGGVPAKMAIVIDSIDFASASWMTYNTPFCVDLEATDGPHRVWIGLKGRASTSQPTWEQLSLTRDSIAPTIVITNPTVATLSQPMIELQGYSLEPLSKVRYDVVNTAGSLLNQEGYVTSHWFDTNIFEFTTNWFQCLDIDLAEGDNFVTVYATDRAGNVSTNNFTYTLDYSNDVTLPAIEISWPTDGTEISGDTFTCRGRLDDFTAKLTLTLTDQSGGAITRTAIVERNGKFWLEDLPLASGTSQLTLVATDAAGNSSTTEICVTRSDLVLTMNPVADDLWQPAVTVSGTVSDASYTVWVNDVEATVNPDGTWSASEVPVNEGGTASFVVSAYAPEEQ